MPETGYVPQQDRLAEQTLLGILLVDHSVFAEYAGELSRDLFYWRAHQYIFDAMKRCFEENKTWDLVTISRLLEEMGKKDAVGGYAYISELATRVTTTASAGYYIDVLRELAMRRDLKLAAKRIEDISMRRGEPVEIASQAEAELMAVLMRWANLAPPADHLHDTFEDYVRLRSGEEVGYSTTFPDLDKLIGGFEPGELVILAARPGQGKSSLAAIMALQQAMKHNLRTGIISLEMAPRRLLLRLVQHLAQVSREEIRSGTPEVHEQIAQAFTKLQKVYNTSFFIEECPATTDYVVATARRLFFRHACHIVYIDHFHHIHDPGMTSVNEMRNASLSRLWDICHDTRLNPRATIVLLAQINRQAEKSRDDPRPQLYHLKDTSELEQKADLVLGLYKPDTYSQDADQQNILEIRVLKNRNRGGVGRTVELYCDMTRQIITPLAYAPPEFLKAKEGSSDAHS